MQLTRRQDTWDPIRELEALSNRMNHLFNLPKWMTSSEREDLSIAKWAPSCDISETASEYLISAELPKVKKEDVQVTMEDGVLTLQGERKEEKEEKDVKVHRRELSYGSFVRRFTLPDDVDDTKVKAAFKDGILNVTIPKSKSKPPKAKQIAVS